MVIPTAAAVAPCIAILNAGFSFQRVKKTVTARTKTEHGIEAANSTARAPENRWSSQPTPVQNARRLVPGVRRARAKQRAKLPSVIHLRLSTISRCKTAVVALPPPNVRLAYRTNTLVRNRRLGSDATVPAIYRDPGRLVKRV